MPPPNVKYLGKISAVALHTVEQPQIDLKPIETAQLGLSNWTTTRATCADQHNTTFSHNVAALT